MASHSSNTYSSGGAGTGGAHPLRPYYQPPEDAPIYVASAPKPAAGSSGSARSATASGSSADSSQSDRVFLPQRAAKNRYATSNDDLEVADIGSISDWLQGGALALLIQYGSTCMAMPFEVGKLLLQVQWVPKDEVWNSFSVAADAEASSQPRRAPKAKVSEDAFQEDDRQEDEGDEDMAPEAQEWRRASDENHYDDSEEDRDIEDEVSAPNYPEEAKAAAGTDTASWLIPCRTMTRRHPMSRPTFVTRQRHGLRSGPQPAHRS